MQRDQGSKNWSILELFAGSGGLALGLRDAGFYHRAMLEFDKFACATLRQNWNETTLTVDETAPLILEEDVRNVDYEQLRRQLGTIDGVVGGPPCQPFSLGGVAMGRSDARNMFPESIRAVSELRPKFFLFENVKGLLRESFADYFQYILAQLSHPSLKAKKDESWREHFTRITQTAKYAWRLDESQTYRVAYRLTDAADYGAPQRRHRVFIIGIRADLNVDPTFPEPTHSYDKKIWEQWISGEYWDWHKIARKARPQLMPDVRKKVDSLRSKYGLFPPSGERWATVRDALRGLPDPKQKNDVPNHEYRAGARPYPGHTGSDYDEPSKALKAGVHGVPGGENMIAFPDGTYRYYTSREAARVQTFPDSYIFCGAPSEAMRQIGNAVPVKLAEAVGKNLLRTLEKI